MSIWWLIIILVIFALPVLLNAWNWKCIAIHYWFRHPFQTSHSKWQRLKGASTWQLSTKFHSQLIPNKVYYKKFKKGSIQLTKTRQILPSKWVILQNQYYIIYILYMTEVSEDKQNCRKKIMSYTEVRDTLIFVISSTMQFNWITNSSNCLLYMILHYLIGFFIQIKLYKREKCMLLNLTVGQECNGFMIIDVHSFYANSV